MNWWDDEDKQYEDIHDAIDQGKEILMVGPGTVSKYDLYALLSMHKEEIECMRRLKMVYQDVKDGKLVIESLGINNIEIVKGEAIKEELIKDRNIYMEQVIFRHSVT